ncbi:hypothetical protein GF325_04445, partial [Candidatus Bathyarchaeota archaeon]|nr:hypothetical protein [Candidatus Bathyarchaeota archaeon]
MPGESFHQFTTHHLYPYDAYEKPKWNPVDKILGNLGLKRFGLDMLAGYCRKFAKNAWELPPFQPAAVPEGKVLIDFHTHTRLSDGEGTFESILQRISRTGVVDGIVFTNHPFTLAKDRRSRIRNPKVIKQSYRAGNVVKDMKEKGQLPDTFMTFPGSCEFAPAGTHDFPRKGVEVIGL